MRIAIVGTGISGLAAAHRLRARHDVVLYEAADYVGGHTNTVDVELRGKFYAIDTGFIVFNDRTYPRFCRLLEELDVPSQPTEMSFSVRCDHTGLEYNGNTLNTLFAQRRNLLNPRFLGLILDILRFNREAPHVLTDPTAPATLGEYIVARGYRAAFADQYLLPMAAAIWSCPVSRVAEFPLRNFVSFFLHHGLLSVNDRPQWHVLQRGSRSYVHALIEPLVGSIRLGTPVRRIRRAPAGVEVATDQHGTERFDRIVVATHSDQALALLADPTRAEASLLGAIPYQTNQVTLHTDAGMLPRSRRAWASWNYRIDKAKGSGISVTYNMNILQRITAPETFCVTLGDAHIDPVRVIRRMTYHHPVFTAAGAEAQRRVAEISGADRIHFAGAYWANGFHEDGMASAERVVDEISQAEMLSAKGEERRRTA